MKKILRLERREARLMVDAAIAKSGANALALAPRLSSFDSPFDYAGQAEVLIVTDVAKGDIASGTEVEMCFRIKDIDELRGFTRYFWKATPVAAGVDTTASKE